MVALRRRSAVQRVFAGCEIACGDSSIPTAFLTWSPCTAAMIATAIPAAMRRYSINVAGLTSLQTARDSTANVRAKLVLLLKLDGGFAGGDGSADDEEARDAVGDEPVDDHREKRCPFEDFAVDLRDVEDA